MRAARRECECEIYTCVMMNPIVALRAISARHVGGERDDGLVDARRAADYRRSG